MKIIILISLSVFADIIEKHYRYGAFYNKESVSTEKEHYDEGELDEEEVRFIDEKRKHLLLYDKYEFDLALKSINSIKPNMDSGDGIRLSGQIKNILIKKAREDRKMFKAIENEVKSFSLEQLEEKINSLDQNENILRKLVLKKLFLIKKEDEYKVSKKDIDEILRDIRNNSLLISDFKEFFQEEIGLDRKEIKSKLKLFTNSIIEGLRVQYILTENDENNHEETLSVLLKIKDIKSHLNKNYNIIFNSMLNLSGLEKELFIKENKDDLLVLKGL